MNRSLRTRCITEGASAMLASPVFALHRLWLLLVVSSRKPTMAEDTERAEREACAANRPNGEPCTICDRPTQDDKADRG